MTTEYPRISANNIITPGMSSREIMDADRSIKKAIAATTGMKVGL